MATVLVPSPARVAPGDLDTSFGDDGIAATLMGPFGSGSRDIAVLPNGKIVVAGSTGTAIGVERHNPDGALDRTFGSSGQATIAVGSGPAQGWSVVFQPDGKLVVGGHAGGDYVVVRLDPTAPSTARSASNRLVASDHDVEAVPVVGAGGEDLAVGLESEAGRLEGVRVDHRPSGAEAGIDRTVGRRSQGARGGRAPPRRSQSPVAAGPRVDKPAQENAGRVRAR